MLNLCKKCFVQIRKSFEHLFFGELYAIFCCRWDFQIYTAYYGIIDLELYIPDTTWPTR